MKMLRKIVLVILLVSTAAMLIYGLAFDGRRGFPSAGLILTIAGVLQLELTDFFKEIYRIYGNEKEYPYGPPSHITREIIDNPDTPARTALKNALFSNRETGVWFLIVGCTFQLIGVWVG